MQPQNEHIKEEELYQTRSPEAQEIIGRMPSWIVKYGLILLACILVLLYIAANFLKYPDVMTARLTISASEFPAKIVSRKTGRFAEILIKDGDHVAKNQVIATFEDSANANDVLYLRKVLTSVDTAIELGDVDAVDLDKHLQLGLLQSSYSDLLIALSDYKKYRSGKQELKLLMEQSVRERVKNMISVIRDWEEKNILKSPATGKALFLKDLGKKIKVKQDEVIMTVNPEGEAVFTVTGMIAGPQSSKVANGNHVMLKVDNYPYTDFGTLDGIIAKVSPLDSCYFINVRLVNGLKTSTGFMIPPQSVITATGDIVLNDKTILQRLFEKYNGK